MIFRFGKALTKDSHYFTSSVGDNTAGPCIQKVVTMTQPEHTTCRHKPHFVNYG